MNNEEIDKQKPKRILSKVGFALFALACIFIFTQSGIDILVGRYYPSLAKTDWYVWVLTAFPLIGLGLPVYLLLMRRIPNSERGGVVKLKPLQFLVIFFVCVAAMHITNILSSILTLVIAYLKGDTHLINPAQEAIMNSNYVMAFIYASIIAPVVEEFIFRKVLLDKLRRFGDVPAILMTGIAFGLFHMNLTQFFYAAVLGFVFAYVTIRTNTIRYAILLHMIINASSTLAAPFVLKGNIIVSMIMVGWVFIAIITGSLILAFNYRKVYFNKTNLLVKRKDYFINVGVICYTLICLVMIAITTIFY